MKNSVSGNGATLETIVILARACVCVCVCVQLMPVQLALRQGFQSPCWALAEAHTADGGMDRREKGRKRNDDGRKRVGGGGRQRPMGGTHAVTH